MKLAHKQAINSNMSHAVSVPRGREAAGRFAQSVAKIPGASCPRLKLGTHLTACGGSLTQFAQQPLSEVLLGAGQRQGADEGRGGGLRVRRHVWFTTARRASRSSHQICTGNKAFPQSLILTVFSVAFRPVLVDIGNVVHTEEDGVVGTPLAIRFAAYTHTQSHT